MVKTGFSKTTSEKLITTVSHNFAIVLLIAFSALVTACATSQLPEERHSVHSFPESRVYVEEPTGRAEKVPYKTLGWVKSRATFPTMEQEPNNPMLCRNYYNKAAALLLKEAQKAGADAVMKVRSIVILFDGRIEEHVTPECSDDGAEGEILLRGIAIKFKPVPKKTRSENNPSPLPVDSE